MIRNKMKQNNIQKKNFILLQMFVLIMLMVCSCGKKQEKKKEAYIKEFEAISEIKPGQPNVYLITKVLDNNYWNIIRESVADAGNEYGVNIYYSGSEIEAEWETQVALLEEAVSAGADAIIIAPDDSTKMSEPINKVYEQGIPVVLIDTAITTECYDICYMTDNLYAGQLAAETMLNELFESGYTEQEVLCVGIEVGSSSSQTISERLAGFSQYWSEHAPKNWTIIDDVKVNNGDVELAVSYGYDFLEQYPNIKGVFGCNNGSTVGLSRAVKNAGRTDIVVMGFDYSDDVADLILDSNYHAATMLQRQFDMGIQGVITAKMLIEGGSVGQKFVDTGVVVVTDENVNTDEIQDIISK